MPQQLRTDPSQPGSAPAKNFGLSPGEFQHLVDELRQDNPLLFERIFLGHFEAGMTYLTKNDGASAEAAYDSMMEALIRFRALLVAGKIHYGNLRYLLTRMARQEYFRRCRQEGRLQIVNGEEELGELPQELPAAEFELLERAFAALDPDCRALLRNFYYNHRSLKEIADAEDRNSAAVRKQKSRCVTKLRHYFDLFS